MGDLKTADLLVCAVEAARTAGDYAVRHFARRTEVHKHFAHDVKLVLDVECQTQAEAVIRRRFPDHAILGEESDGAFEDDTRPLWIIDPIDGTVNFSHGLPLWCCSVAVRWQGRMLAGAVYAPMMNRFYSASADTPAVCNGQPIVVSAVPRLDQALIVTGMDSQMDATSPSFRIFKAVAQRSQKVRMPGAAAINACLVAAGEADGYMEYSAHIWDVAAAMLIVERAGGVVEICEQYSPIRLRPLFSNGLIQAEFREVVEGALEQCP